MKTMKTLKLFLLLAFAFTFTLNSNVYSQSNEKAIINSYKRFNKSGLKPDIKYGNNFKAHINRIEQYAGEKASKRKSRRYWLELVYIENKSYELAESIAGRTADMQFESNARKLITNNNKRNPNSEENLNRAKRSKKPIAALIRYKKKTYSVCIVYAYEFVWS